jgi:integrase/recombinase XerD
MRTAQDPHAELFARFRRYLEMEEGRSPRTAREYLMDASLFSRWFRERHGRPPRWEEVGSQHVRAFLASREVRSHQADEAHTSSQGHRHPHSQSRARHGPSFQRL